MNIYSERVFPEKEKLWIAIHIDSTTNLFPFSCRVIVNVEFIGDNLCHNLCLYFKYWALFSDFMSSKYIWI